MASLSHRTAGWWPVVVLGASFLLAVVFLREDKGLLPFNGYDRVSSYFSVKTQENETTEIPLELTSRGTGACLPDKLIGDNERHRQEHKKLLQRLKRPGKGKFDSTVPRHRLLSALHGFYRYGRTTQKELDKIKTRFQKNISKEKRELINSAIDYESKIKQNQDLVWENDRLAQDIFHCALEFYEVDPKEFLTFAHEVEKSGKEAERVVTTRTIKHYVRDWASEGEHERETFPHILEALKKHFPKREKGDVRVNVPGSGVGRLAHDIAGLGGFDVTANEWSSYMNMAYRYVTAQEGVISTTFYPFINWWSHQPTTKELHRAVGFPDVAVDQSSVLLVEGDFTTVFNGQEHVGSYDAVVTYFFIDTARNMLSYIETIHKILKPGGIWINLGPLLYGSNPTLQLSLDEVIDLAEKCNFEFLETDPRYGDFALEGGKGWVRTREAPYGFNRDALWKNAYWASLWVARRK